MRRRFFIVVRIVTALGHVVPTLAWCALVPWWAAVAIGVGFWMLTQWRVGRLFRDPERPRWTVRFVDMPVFWHWGAGFLALPLLLVSVPFAFALSVGGCAPGTLTATAPAISFTSAALASFGLGLVISGWSTWGRRRFVQLREVPVPIESLPAELDGYRIAHLSDLHIGSYDTKARGLEWVERSNRLEPDLVLVTGDLVTSGTRFYADVAEVIGALRAKDGVLVSLGNHDQWDPAALVAELEKRGARVLRNQWVTIERGAALLCVAGLDDRYTKRDDLEKTLAGRPAGVPTVLMSHYPDYFRGAAERGVDLTLSGHTHGGQFGIPFVSERANFARMMGQASRGLYRRGKSTLYVSSGLGTTGPPMRLGVAPEIALLVLRDRANMPES
jgi:predicted MPP superfamily phosphohydrolase